MPVAWKDNDLQSLLQVIAALDALQSSADYYKLAKTAVGNTVLNPASMHHFSHLEYAASPWDAAGKLVDWLEGIEALDELPAYTGLGKFLTFVIDNLNIAPADQIVLARLVIRYRLVTQPATLSQLATTFSLDAVLQESQGAGAGLVSPQPANARDRLGAARAQRQAQRAGVATPSTRKRYENLDQLRILREFDLVKQEATFSLNLANVTPPCLLPVAAADERTILKEYVLPRFRRVLQQTRMVTPVAHDLWLTTSDLAQAPSGFHTLQKAFADTHAGAELLDTLSAEGVDCLLIIWNRDIPTAELDEFAQRCLQEASLQLQPLLAQKAIVFVMVWANRGVPLQQAGFVIPPVDSFGPINIPAWFRQRLQAEGVETQVIDASVLQLETVINQTHGDPPEIYRIMQDILTRVREGTIV